MRDDPDPERTESVGERVDARHYGDPEDDRPPHVAPPDGPDVVTLCRPGQEVWDGDLDRCPDCGTDDVRRLRPRDPATGALRGDGDD